MPVAGENVTDAPGRKLAPSIFRSRLAVPCGAEGGVTLVTIGTVTTRAVSSAWLFTAFGSVSLPTTIAEFTTVPARTALATIVIVAPAPTGRSPRLHVTTAPPAHEPWLALAETNATSEGRPSITSTPVDGSGPAFPT